MKLGLGLGMSFPAPPSGDSGEENWWTAGGVDPSSVISAYQAKGAASYAASKLNLANPGTHDLTDVSAPTWNATDGWVFSGAEALNTGLRKAQLGRGTTCSFIARYSDIPNDDTNHAILGGQWEEENAENIPTISIEVYTQNVLGSPTTGTIASYDEAISSCSQTALLGNVSGVECMAGKKTYYNGSLAQDRTACAVAWADTFDIPPVYIGTLNWEYEIDPGVYDPYAWFKGKIQAVAFYNSVLTPEQVAAITTAMQAL